MRVYSGAEGTPPGLAECRARLRSGNLRGRTALVETPVGRDVAKSD
ncbi:MAG: hypothetical protein J6J65_04650 [Opitutales bacterium]|nr:hypothetical protein [Opitutales bacterium]